MKIYSMIFGFFYGIALRKKNNVDPRFYASALVTLFQIVHLVLAIAILRNRFESFFRQFYDSPLSKEYTFIPLIIIWFLLVYFFFNRSRIKTIKEKYLEKQNILNFRYAIMLLALLVFPIIITGYLI